MPLLSANCPFCRGIWDGLGCPSFLPCCCWSHSYRMGSVRGERLCLAHQHQLLQKISANLAWFTFVPCWQGGKHHSCPLLRAQGPCLLLVQVAICHHSPIAAPFDLLVCTSLVSVVKLAAVPLQNHLVRRLLQYLCTVERREEIQTVSILETCLTVILDVPGKW